jgi:5-formyltetrahydrofolate cyclo-ligase
MEQQGDHVAAKAALRQRALARRAQAFLRHGEAAKEAAAAIADASLRFRQGLIVSAYLAMRDELDPAPLLVRAGARGAIGALPTVVGKGEPLCFRRWMPGDATRPAGLGTREPLQDAPEVLPDLLIVPLLAFDAEGYRLGYGGGFFDRTLATLRRHKAILAVGYAYAEQEVDAVPREVHDQRLDAILTPAGYRLLGH